MAEPDKPQDDARWHLDKRVPLAIIVTLILQALWFATYIARLDARINSMETWILDQRVRDERQDRLMADTANLLRAELQYIRSQLDTLIREQARERAGR